MHRKIAIGWKDWDWINPCSLLLNLLYLINIYILKIGKISLRFFRLTFPNYLNGIDFLPLCLTRTHDPYVRQLASNDDKYRV